MLVKKLQELTDELNKIDGIKVYANIEDSKDTTYMFITNGKCVLYVEYGGGFFGLSVCLEYYPDRFNGSGCVVADEDVINGKPITADTIIALLNEFSNDMSLTTLHKYNECIKSPITFYKNENDWYDKLWENYKYQIVK